MTEGTRPAAHIAGTMTSVDGKGIVRMECRYDTDLDDLWSALTDRQRVARWIADVEGDLHVGAHFRATFTSGWAGTGRVDVCHPPRHLLVTLDPGAEDETVIEATLSAEGGQTMLVIEERGLPLAHIAQHGAGWQAHVEDLAAHLAGSDPGDWSTRWSELVPTYRGRIDFSV